MTGEFDLIERHFRPLARCRHDGLITGIGDDAAVLECAPGQQLAVTTDSLVAGVHFPEDTTAEDIGWKSLACSLSDLAAMGAAPAWALLALTLPERDEAWLSGFAAGFSSLADAHGVDLIGGDVTRGPVAVITVQAIGHVPAGQALVRGGARPGDAVWVSGNPGEAAAGLARIRAGGAVPDDPLVARLNRPSPRIALGCALRGLATACIDVSDGLASDLAHVLAASGAGAVIDVERLPVSAALAEAGERPAVMDWILHGGDDYELCFTMSKTSKNNNINKQPTPIYEIGAVISEPGLRLRSATGECVDLPAGGHDHFRSAGDD